jgi:hypothetical protein
LQNQRSTAQGRSNAEAYQELKRVNIRPLSINEGAIAFHVDKELVRRVGSKVSRSAARVRSCPATFSTPASATN